MVSICQLWQAVGAPCITYAFDSASTAIIVRHSGMLIPQAVVGRIGTGTPSLAIYNCDVYGADETEVKVVSGQYAHLNFEGVTMAVDELIVRTCDAIDTDLPFVHSISFVIRSEQ